MDCLFCQIINKKIKSDIVYEDEQVIAIKDINPQAPIHVLLIPVKHIATINDLTDEDNLLMGHMLNVAKKTAKDLGTERNGYRLVYNVNKGGGQEVFHIHLHLLGGRNFSWPPG